MTYAEAIRFLDSRINYERRGMPANKDLRLDRMALLLEAWGNPERCYPIVHIAGTKGKGSTAHMIAAFLEAAGYRVGLHCSPHFLHLEERFCVNGRPAGCDQVADLIEQLTPIIEKVDRQLAPEQPSLTFFEITTAMALKLFADAQVDWAVIEVGMGGRLDATNIVEPMVSVITTISKDHTRQLGDTLGSIATEKAGIIKQSRPVVSGVRGDEPANVIRKVAADLQCPLREIDRDFAYAYTSRRALGGVVTVKTWRQTWPPIELALLGEHQAANCAVALAVLDVLAEHQLKLEPERIAGAVSKLALPGRIQVVMHEPVVILDAAHNSASAVALRDTLRMVFPRSSDDAGRRVLVFGCSRDKDWRTMLGFLAGEFDLIVATEYEGNPRRLPASELAGELVQLGVLFLVAPNPTEAWKTALELLSGSTSQDRDAPRNRSSDSLICAAGSFFLAAEFFNAIRLFPPQPAPNFAESPIMLDFPGG